MNIWRAIAAVYGFFAVMAGAAASHAIADAHAADMVKTAALYALLHATVLLCWQGEGRLALAARLSLASGILLFSGALMLKYMAGMDSLGQFAPIGGSLLMGGWALIAASAVASFRRAA